MAEIRAGDLHYHVHCQRRVEQDDGYGNTVAEFATQFSVRAAYRHLRGGETVIASRLENRHPMIITVRSSSLTRQIGSDWQLVDARDNSVWAVRDVTHETDRQWISLLCERGVASLVLSLTFELELLRDAISDVERIFRTLSTCHGQRHRALEKRIEGLIYCEAPLSGLETHDIGDGCIVCEPSPEIKSIIRDARDMGVI